MLPRLFSVADIAFPSYFGLLLTGFLFATTLGVLWARRIGEDPDVIVNLGLTTIIFGTIGARLLHVVADGYFWDYVHLCTNPQLVDWPLTKTECLAKAYDGVWDAARAVCHPKEADCFAWAKFWSGGLTYYGGLIAAVLSSWYFLRVDKFPFWRAADMAGFVIPIGLAFGRMGCLLAGCCFGTITSSPLGLSFPSNSPASELQWKAHLLATKYAPSLSVHPTQIYESILSLAIAATCLFLVHPRKRYDGQVFVWFLVLYAVARFVLEIFRSDDRGGLFGLSTSQLIGIAMIGAAIVLHRRLRHAPAACCSTAAP
jgi:phosphatidylglycerol:prolipoprotein diacylglycerol transferase